MLNNLKKRNEGFTIIEVLIVLAIAGLILLVVLLAVPALQRNSRNTTMKNDVSAISGGVSEFATNNDGAQPLAANSSQTGSSLNLNNASGTATVAKIQASDVVTFKQASVAAITGVAGNIVIDFGVSCTNGTTGGTATAPTFTPATLSARATAIIYSNEVANGLQIKCVDS